MKGNKKLIKFSEHVDSNNEETEEYYDDSYFETDSNLYYSESWKELIKLRENYSRQKPDDPFSLWRLGEAYVLNGEYEKALNYLKDLHIRYPDYGDVQHSILDCLFALGKNEEDFEWEEKPSILRISKEV